MLNRLETVNKMEMLVGRINELNVSYEQYAMKIQELPEPRKIGDISSIVRPEVAAKPEMVAYCEEANKSRLELLNASNAVLAATCIYSISAALLQAYSDLHTYLKEQAEKMLAIDAMEKIVAKEISEFTRNNMVFKKMSVDVDRVAEAFIFKDINKDEVMKVKNARSIFNRNLYELDVIRIRFLKRMAQQPNDLRVLLFSLIDSDKSDVESFMLMMGDIISKKEIDACLRLAADRGQVENLKQLLLQGDVLSTNDLGGRNALHLAVIKGRVDCVALLLAYQGAPNVKVDLLLLKRDKLNKSAMDYMNDIRDEIIKSDMQALLQQYKEKSAPFPNLFFGSKNISMATTSTNQIKRKSQ